MGEAWVEKDPVTGGTKGGVRRPPGKRIRCIILGAGGEMGWIPSSKKHTGDYHDEMTVLRNGLGISCFPMFPQIVLSSWTMPHIILDDVRRSQLKAGPKKDD